MEQVQQYIDGEKDYTKIKGGTGPLVYPAAHVYIYTLLYHATQRGTDILRAQGIFAILYLATLALVMACYRRAKAPPYVFPMLVLSKRLHSIFVLRCFNDGFAIFFLWAAIYFYQRRFFTIGSVVYSWGLGVKMSLLLTLPALAVVLLLTRGVTAGLKQAWMMFQVQVVIAFPFLPVNAIGYLGRAFEFSRQFLFKWTVNWRFVGEDTFLSKEFSISLLVGHITALVLFALTSWLKPAGQPVHVIVARMFGGQEPLGNAQQLISSRITPRWILTTVLTANVIGMLFARSLHYQFYAYLAWSTPFLLWRSGMHPTIQLCLWAAQEWAWNVYPSTVLSSEIVVSVMAVTLVGVWWGTRSENFPTIEDRAQLQKSEDR
jgi:alpha-1,3-mannosyltransferase